jgi:type II secretory pathway component GspD/PulD (secretin)
MQTDGSRILGSSVTAAEMTSADALLRSLGSNLEIVGSIIKQEDGDTLNFIFQALSSLQHTEILSAPRVTTLNRKPAVVASIKTEYFPAQVYTNVIPITSGGFGSGITASIITNVVPQAFIFGITLSVTPQIGKGNMIRLWLNPQIIDFLGEKVFFNRQTGPFGDIVSEMRLPTTQVQAVWTNVYVNDGDTLVLGGLVRDKTESFEERLPWISRVPVLGFFFRGEGKRVSQDNLLIFVTVNLIDSTGAKWTGPLEEEGFSTF